MKIDRIAWINLEKRLDRRCWMEKEIPRSRYLLSADEIVRQVPKPPHRLMIPRSFTHHRGHFSCRRVQLEIIESAWLDEVERLLILEDDMQLEPDFDERTPRALAELPSDWMVCYLGGTHQRAAMPYSKHLRVCRGVTSNHAYILSRAGMEACYDEALSLAPTIAIDQAFSQMHFRLAAESRAVCFAATPWLVHARGDYSDNNQAWDSGTRQWQAKDPKNNLRALVGELPGSTKVEK